MVNRRSLLVGGACLICLQIAGACFPTSLTWGFHFLGFLPQGFLLGYVALALGGIYLVASDRWDRVLTSAAGWISQKPNVSLAFAVFVFVSFAIIFRVNAPLLGDSFVKINNFTNTFLGVHPLSLGVEPLAMYYFYWIMSLLGTTTYPGVMNGFLVAELLLGIGFIINAGLIVKHLFKEEKIRPLAFLFLTMSPSLQLFFGYAEIYAVVLFLLSMNVLLIILAGKEKISAVIVMPAYTLLVLSHYLSLLLFPAFAYLLYKEYVRSGARTIVYGLLLCAGVGVLTALAIGIHRLVPPLDRSHFLSLTPVNDGYQAYTLFSPYHAIDLLNLGALLFPAVLFVIYQVFAADKRAFWTSIQGKVFILATVPILIFIPLAKFDLGMAKDWDVVAPYSFVISLAAWYWLDQVGNPRILRTMGMLVILLGLQSMLYFSLNATEEESAERARTLLDKRLIAPDGFYQSTFHLAMYFYEHREADEMVTLWHDYIREFPRDATGYRKLMQSYANYGERGYSKIDGTFEEWTKVDSTDPVPRKEHADFYASIGDTARAVQLYQQAARLGSEPARRQLVKVGKGW